MKKYKVLWFDDEFKELESQIVEPAFLENIDLVGFNNAKEGIEVLEAQLFSFDAVIVDGLFFRNKEQSGDISSDNALADVIKKLHQLQHLKMMPWFILSGQPSFTANKNSLVENFADDKVYDKMSNVGLSQLWRDIKAAADTQPDTQIRHKYADLFELCSEDYLGVQNTISLMEAIKDADSPHLPDQVKAMERIRDFIERMFAALNKKQLIPDDVWNEQGRLNKSSLFLAGKHPRFAWKNNPVHPTIIFLLKGVLDISQDVKHDVPDKLTLKVKDYMHQHQSSYLYKAQLFQAFELLRWFHKFMLDNPDPEANKSLWNYIAGDTDDAIEGLIEMDESGNYHCCGILLGHKWVQEHSLRPGCPIRILIKTDNTKERTKHQYPFFAQKIDILK